MRKQLRTTSRRPLDVRRETPLCALVLAPSSFGSSRASTYGKNWCVLSEKETVLATQRHPAHLFILIQSVRPSALITGIHSNIWCRNYVQHKFCDHRTQDNFPTCFGQLPWNTSWILSQWWRRKNLASWYNSDTTAEEAYLPSTRGQRVCADFKVKYPGTRGH